MLIFRYAATGQLSCADVFNEIAQSVDVTKEGVHAAADFFQAKVFIIHLHFLCWLCLCLPVFLKKVQFRVHYRNLL